MHLELISDSSLTLRQVKALIWRYVIILSRSYLKTALRMVLTPLVALLLFKGLKYIFDSAGDSSKIMATYVPILALFVTLPHVHHYLEFMVSDRSSGFRSLMMIMGLRRTSYYLANLTCFTTYISVIAVIFAFISINHIFQDSEASAVEMTCLFLLFSLHLATFVFALASMISSSMMVGLLVYSTIILEPLYHRAIIGLASGIGDSFRPIFLFLSIIFPYESIHLFSDSYILCSNCNKSLLVQSMSLAQVSQTTDLILAAILFWTFASLIFGCWFDRVCPWTADLPSKDPLFCLPKCAKSSQNSLFIDDSFHELGEYFESTIIGQPVGIRISKVTKKFDQIPAVDALSFNVHKGETTLLLGHNGAGKTTLMNMIFGKLNPDSGRVTVNRLSTDGVSTNAPFIGVCLQSNVFDERLTVRQHLELFADIKSAPMTPVERSRHIKTTIEDVSLTGHANKTPEELSGGMKRKLSLAMAFVGKSSVLILDEPSSGLDPDSRIFVWDAIRRYRADRTLLLSTQHMEEADYLGDRIAIMKAGKIVCCGSSSFLNKMFGSGYRLRVECSESKRNEVISFIKGYFQEAFVEDDISGGPASPEDSEEYTLNLVIMLKSSKQADSESDIIRLLEELERDMSAHHIKSFGLKSSSIEDVMLQTANIETTRDEVNPVKINLEPKQPININPILLRAPKAQIEGCFVSQLYLLKALLCKHLHIYRRNFWQVVFYRLILATGGIYFLVQTISIDFSIGSINILMIIHFIYYPARENVSKFKSVQLASEVNFITYWLAQFLIDSLSIIYLVIIADVVLRRELNQSEKFEPPSDQVRLIISTAVALLATSAILLAYITSTVIKSARSAVSIYLSPFVTSVILCSLTKLAPLFARGASAQTKEILNKINSATESTFIALLPTDSMQYIIYGLRKKCYLKMKNLNCVEAPGVSPVALGYFALFGQIVAFSLLLYLIDRKLLDISSICKLTNCLSCLIPKTNDGYQTKDEDVLAEATKAMQTVDDPSNSSCLVAADLSKSYVHGVKVIDELSFTVARGECFGLLGVNGAGKSTTFSILAAECRPDRGRVCLRGNYLDDNLNLYRRNTGYDPQISPAELPMSASEALYLMARLRQVEESAIPVLVSSILEVLDMRQHADKLASELSGGTLRKLSLGMSLIGNPDLLLLDEPTAGVDPLARRGIWRLLRSLRNQDGTSIVIASHAMEECEAICDRISIMARGRLRCIGSFLHLRNKFSQSCSVQVQFSGEGDYYTGEIATHTRTIEQLTERLDTVFGPHIELVDSNISSVTYNISDRYFKRSVLFRTLREFRQSRSNMSYLINDSSLEDIFLELAREQRQLQSDNSTMCARLGDVTDITIELISNAGEMTGASEMFARLLKAHRPLTWSAE